jgi:hypothetical protein
MKIQSICTVAKTGEWKSLEGLLQSISIYNPFTPIFICTTSNIVKNIMNSELSDGRIQIKLNVVEDCKDLDNIMKDIISIALDRYNNTCYLNVNSFFCQDVKNILFESGRPLIEKHKDITYFAITEKNKTELSHSMSHTISMKNCFVNINTTTYDTEQDANNVIMFRTLINNSEGKFYNNHTDDVFKNCVLKYYRRDSPT